MRIPGDPSKPLRIGVIKYSPYTTDCALDPICADRGFAVDAAILTCRTMLFDCTFEWFESTDFGGKDENGTWTGMIGAMLNGRYDTSLPIFTRSMQRFEVVDVSQTFFKDQVIFATRTPPDHEAPIDTGLFSSFHWQVWLVIAATTVILSLILTIVEQIRPVIGEADAWGVDRALGARMALINSAVFSLLIASLYNGCSISNSLTFNNNLPYTDFVSFVDCVEKLKCRVISTPNSSTLAEVLEQSNRASIRLKDALSIRPPIELPNSQLILEKILAENAPSYLTWFTTKVRFASESNNNEGCHFFPIASQFINYIGFPMRKNFIYAKLFNRMGSSYSAYGLDDVGPFKSRPSRCARATPSGEPVSVTIESMFILFIFCAVGIFLSLIAFYMEKYEKFGNWIKRLIDRIGFDSSGNQDRGGKINNDDYCDRNENQVTFL